MAQPRTRDLTGLLVLPADATLEPVSALPKAVRDEIAVSGDEVALTRLHSRLGTIVIGPAAARLLREFTSPRRIVDVLIATSRRNKSDPRASLIESYPFFRQMVELEFLVHPEAVEADRSAGPFQIGDRIGESTVIASVNTPRDTAVYKVRRRDGALGALKIATDPRDRAAAAMVRTEAAALRKLNPEAAPILVAEGVADGRTFLLLQWIEGSSLEATFLAVRGARQPVLALCGQVVESYALLHRRGVIHGDVHPGNVLVRSDGRVTLLDFGESRLTRTWHGVRGGVPFYLEPEYAKAVRTGQPLPPPTAKSEQFAIAAMLFFLVTGHHYLRFRLTEPEMMRQIEADFPLAFVAVRAEPWPELESVLFRALAKEPRNRFPSVAHFAAALRRLSSSGRTSPVSSGAPRLDFPTSVINALAPNGEWREPASRSEPAGSVFMGRPGTAYGLYRLACARDDPQLLARADQWLSSIEIALRRADTFVNRQAGITETVTGRISPFHCRSGVHFVRAMLAQAVGDVTGFARAVRRFVRASSGPCRSPELTFGRSGSLLAAGALLELAPANDRASKARLGALGNTQVRHLERRIAKMARIGRSPELRNLGMAHGWAGVLFARLRWSQATDRPTPSWVESRLHELARLAEIRGRAARWPWILTGSPKLPAGYAAGWCNGSAGMALLWAAAYEALREPRFLGWAERAAWETWEGEVVSRDLCCGAAGQAYGLLSTYRVTGDRRWLRRARTLTDVAVGARRRTVPPGDLRTPHGLFHGAVGIAVLAQDMEMPATAQFPVLEANR